MKYSAADEGKLLEDILSFSHDPLAFTQYVYPWGEKGTPLENHKGPRGWQREMLEEVRDHVKKQQFALDNGLDNGLTTLREAIASGRGIGKSALFGMLANWQVSTHLGATVIVTAITEAQLRTKTFPEFGRWMNMSLHSHWWDVESMAIRPKPWLSKMVRDQLKIDPQYWNIAGLNWSEENPDAFAGAHSSYGLAVFYDEASGIPEPIWTVSSGFFTELTAFRLWMVFSNPRRNSGAFFDRFNDPDKSKGWVTRQIDARSVEGTDQNVYQQIIDAHGENSDQARVEVYGMFPEQGEGQLIPTSSVRAAQNRDIGAAEDNDEPVIIGVDPAPRGRTAIRTRQGRDAKSYPRVILEGSDNIAIADAVVALTNKYDPDAIVVDAGNGTGVIDELKRRHVRVHEVWFGNTAMNSNGEFAMVGGEMWGKMRDWLPGGCIDDSSELFNDLTKRTWKWFGGREDGKKTLTSKRDMAREGIPSPDDADALALTFYPSLPKRNKRTRRGRHGTQVAIGVGECEF